MKCRICKGGTREPGTTTVTLQRGDTTVVIRKVPAEVCSNCGEAYVGEETARAVLAIAEAAAASRVELEVRDFAA